MALWQHQQQQPSFAKYVAKIVTENKKVQAALFRNELALFIVGAPFENLNILAFYFRFLFFFCFFLFSCVRVFRLISLYQASRTKTHKHRALGIHNLCVCFCVVLVVCCSISFALLVCVCVEVGACWCVLEVFVQWRQKKMRIYMVKSGLKSNTTTKQRHQKIARYMSKVATKQHYKISTLLGFLLPFFFSLFSGAQVGVFGALNFYVRCLQFARPPNEKMRLRCEKRRTHSINS